MRFDIHTNIGQFPGSKKGVPVYCSVDNMVEYLIRNDITHHICLYPYNGYHLLEDLQLKLPDVQHYGLQCVMGVDEDNPTDIKNLQLDILDGNKTLCKGVKIASHRGWWLIKNKIQSGIDYGSQSRIIRKHILDVLPDNCIISWHLQGDPICNSGSTPMHSSLHQYGVRFNPDEHEDCLNVVCWLPDAQLRGAHYQEVRGGRSAARRPGD